MSETPPKVEVTKLEISTKNLNVGDTTARLGFSVNIGQDEADFITKCKLLCGTRLKIKLFLTQESLPGIEAAKPIEGAVDSKNIGVSPKCITGGFVFNLSDNPSNTLGDFAKKDCTVEVQRIGLAESDEDDND